MKLEERLKLYQCEKQREIEAQGGGKTDQCIRRVTDVFLREEEKKRLSYFEFLWLQSSFVQKKWWLLQAVFMLVVWIGLTLSGSTELIKKGLGVFGSLFVVMIIPELWKNKTNCAMEVEDSCFYTMRQIYSARLLLFLLVDTVIISCFCVSGVLAWKLAIRDLMIHFMLPMTVTGGICFGTLCSKHIAQEGIAVILCFLWSGVWSFIVMNHNLYQSVDDTVWFCVLFLSVLYLGYHVYKLLKGSGERLVVSSWN